jgi:hypothetical protein
VPGKRRQKTSKFSGFINARVDVTYRFTVKAASKEEAIERAEDIGDDLARSMPGLSLGEWEVVDGPRIDSIELD